MAVHFVFAASKQWESVAVEGDSIALWQLKDEVFNLKFRKALEKRSVKERFDFRVFDAESKEEILGELTRIPRHSRVVVKRLPAYIVSEVEKKQQQAIHSTTGNPNARPIDDGFGDDVFSTASCVSSDRNQSSATSAPRSWSSHAGETQHVKQRVVKNRVTNNSSKVVTRVAQQQKKQAEVTSAQQKQIDVVTLESSVVGSEVVEIPPDLKCSVCHGIMKDAVLIPCCCSSFCVTCVTSVLVADHMCPSCGSSKCKPADVLPNRSLNASVALYLKTKAGKSLTPSQAISNVTSSSSCLSEEHKQTNIITQSPHVTKISSATVANPDEKKRKLAPQVANAKRTKSLIISLATQPKAAL